MSSRLVTKCKLELFKEKLKTSKIYLEGMELFSCSWCISCLQNKLGFLFLALYKKILGNGKDRI